jgi:hypothetical protein
MPIEDEVRPRPDDIEQALKYRIVQQTGKWIQALEVNVLDDHITIRGWTATFQVNQLALQGLLEVIEAVGSTRIEHNIQVEGYQPNTDTVGV